ncbi:MAG TPA: hypothetical protein VFJ24_11910 [Gaiellales bacterium]|nr:hypothetical protein [Gaiellales bacterium]
MSIYLLSDIIADIRTVTEHDSDTQVADSQLVALLKSEYFLLRRRLAEIVPDLYTVYSETWTLTNGGTNAQDLSLTPVFAADILKILMVERQGSSSTTWYPLQLTTRFTQDVPISAESLGGQDVLPPAVTWRQLGATTVEIFPASSPVGTYRALYTSDGGITLWNTATQIEVPPGADAFLRERTAAMVRGRFQEDPAPHLASAADLWAQLEAYLTRLNPATPRRVIDTSWSWG